MCLNEAVQYDCFNRVKELIEEDGDDPNEVPSVLARAWNDR